MHGVHESHMQMDRMHTGPRAAHMAAPAFGHAGMISSRSLLLTLLSINSDPLAQDETICPNLPCISRFSSCVNEMVEPDVQLHSDGLERLDAPIAG